MKEVNVLACRRKGSNFLGITGHGAPERTPEISDAVTVDPVGMLLRCAGFTQPELCQPEASMCSLLLRILCLAAGPVRYTHQFQLEIRGPVIFC